MPEYRIQRVGGSKGGTFFVVWQEGGARKRASLGTKDAATARARLGEYVRQRTFQERQGEQLTVGAIYNAYIDNRDQHGTVAMPRIRDCWKWLAPTFDRLLPVDVSQEVCRTYIAERTRLGLSSGTIRIELGYLRAALRYALVGGSTPSRGTNKIKHLPLFRTVYRWSFGTSGALPFPARSGGGTMIDLWTWWPVLAGGVAAFAWCYGLTCIAEGRWREWLWKLSERADWYGWRPRRFWSWLLRAMDRAHGYHDGYVAPPNDNVGQVMSSPPKDRRP